MRMDEQARKRELLAQQGQSTTAQGQAALVLAPALTKPVGPEENPSRDPAGWAQKHWPVLAAVGVVLATTLVLGLAVALDNKMAVQ
jgi:hypothetical protein